MRTIKCDQKKGGCGNDFTIDETTTKQEEWMQCPICRRQFPNPFWEGEQDGN